MEISNYFSTKLQMIIHKGKQENNEKTKVIHRIHKKKKGLSTKNGG